MLRNLFRTLDERCPGLARLVGGRLDIQLPALSGSLLAHALLLSLVGTITYAVSTDRNTELRSEVRPMAALEDFATLEPTELAAIDDTTLDPVAATAGPAISPRVLETPPLDTPPATRAATAATGGDGPPTLAGPELALDHRFALPQATRLGDSVAVRGTGAEHVGESEGAVDRVAIEILRKLEKGRTLVVWAFDASGSLLAERQRLAKYIDQVYAHIAQFDQDGLADREALLTAVIGFGKTRKELAAPTADAAVISAAILAVPLDETGFESTFQTVADTARKYGKFEKDGESYRTVMVIVTDEIGDDQDRLEPAIAAARAAAMPVYVLGSPALFGRIKGRMDYRDPKTGQLHRDLEVDAGPETAAPEMIRLPFWYSGPQHEFLDSGFGPWALSRLARQTGGIYFITRLGPARRTFEPAGLLEYAPDWDSQKEFLNRVGKSPLRQAVLHAAQMTQQNLPGMPSLTFPAAESPQFKDAMARNQELAARVMYTVDEALVPINAVVKARDHEPARRWRAHYDLARGRLLAVKIRCFEYNWICAKMKKDMPRFANPKSNAWRLVPSGQVQSSAKAGEAAKEARALLERVLDEHPGTPWALLAERELKDPFGFQWVETYVPPPPPERPRDPAARKKAERPAMKPPEPPKL